MTPPTRTSNALYFGFMLGISCAALPATEGLPHWARSFGAAVCVAVLLVAAWKAKQEDEAMGRKSALERKALNIWKSAGDWFQMVLEFNRAIGAHIEPDTSNLPPPEVRLLRVRLLIEEMAETFDAMAGERLSEVWAEMAVEKFASFGVEYPHPKDIEGIADGLADLIVVAIGTAQAYGIDLRPVFDEVHAANMRKLDGPKRADGKQLKPEGWKGPDIRAALDRGENLA